MTEAVKHGFYVNDLLHSVQTKEEAISTGKGLQQMLKKRGFNLTKWGSNDKDVITAFNPEDRAKGLQSLNFQESTLPQERALGLNWNQETDRLQIAAKPKDAVFTKRGL